MLANCKVIPVDITGLKNILKNDPEKRQLLLKNLAYRFLTIYYEQVPKLNLLSESNMRILCNMSRF